MEENRSLAITSENMPSRSSAGQAPDALVVGGGPNGLSAAITMARAGCSVVLHEARPVIGGGARTAALTLPGFRHDVCSAVHPLGVSSPFFRGLPLDRFGLEWIYPPYALAHPLDDGTAVVIERSVAASAATMGEDAAAYRRLMAPLVRDWQKIIADLLGPLPLPPRHLTPAARFGLPALLPASLLSQLIFRGPRAKAVFAGMAAHSILPLEAPLTASFGIMLGLLAHAAGWPIARGGSQAVADAMAAYFLSLGGRIVTSSPVSSLDDLPASGAVLFDLTPRQILEVAGDRLPAGYRGALSRYRYGPGVFKIDYALDGPLPWTARECLLAGTVHLGGTANEIRSAEAAVWRGEHPDHPFVLLAQQSLFDDTRAPRGRHTLWAYCHVPNGSKVDMRGAVEAQIERFAPGFRSRIIARSVMTASDMEAYNANYIGGDINGGAQTLGQFFTRPVARLDPYQIPGGSLYICSSSTPPGGGVHGMCGYYAARSALNRREASNQGHYSARK